MCIVKCLRGERAAGKSQFVPTTEPIKSLFANIIVALATTGADNQESGASMSLLPMPWLVCGQSCAERRHPEKNSSFVPSHQL